MNSVIHIQYTLMKLFTSLLSCLLLLVSFSIAAQTSVLSTNSQPIDEDRYDDIKGTPYLFKEPIKADLLTNKDEIIEDVYLNYNGYDHGVEVYKNGRVIFLDERKYPKIIIRKHGLKGNVDGDMVLVPAPQKSAAKGMYFQEIYSSPSITLYKKFRIAKKENKINTPGETVVQQRFSKYTDYYIKQDGELILVKDKLDDFIKLLGQKEELKTYAKKNKNKLKSDQDIKELMEYYGSLEL